MRGQQARGRNKLSAGMFLAGCTQSALGVKKKTSLKKINPESKMHKYTKSISRFDLSEKNNDTLSCESSLEFYYLFVVT